MSERKPSWGIAGRIAQAFLNSKLTPLMVIASLAVYSTGIAIEDAGLKLGQMSQGQGGK